LVFNVNLPTLSEKTSKVGHIFFFGDLNYRVFSLDRTYSVETFFTKTAYEYVYHNFDELKRELSLGRIQLDFEEGIDNEGPMFAPTCKMRKPRKKKEDSSQISDIYNLGSGQRKPSWCDRILYYDSEGVLYKTHCIYYDRLDEGKTMQKSDHAAVVGIFQIKIKDKGMDNHQV
jgi:hypothetical protein